ncbi:MAG: hypothetical protein BAJALOKI2v1_590023 [Promethearchaeota archaeon]|nr:MAG: hypothetical protein BAJALOKI2v1_590023 [Candidatus Lokiarchaeota archaeon]
MPSEERKVGLMEEGKFYPCPEKHVCVSSQSPKDDEDHYMEPMTYEGSLEDAKKNILNVINSMSRTKVLEENDNYIHVLFTTFLLRFKDDVEFYFDDTEKLIHFRSQSRIGGFDWNKNKKRMKKIKEKYNSM